ncbi:MAG: lipocalin family protein [Pricia sp.]
MNKNHVFNTSILLVLSTFLFFGCTKNDDTDDSKEDIEPTEEVASIYDDALTTADRAKLIKTWSIYEGILDGENVEIPANIPACGRDFFSYSTDGYYTEYEITDGTDCTGEIFSLRYNLDKGILTYSDDTGETLELVIVELTDSKFIFKVEVDYNNNGTLDIFTFTAQPYTPPNDIDLYGSTFSRDQFIPHYDKIQLSWRPYAGFNTFDRYEIYRSNAGCDKTDVELIATIRDKDTNSYIDENPTAETQLCYFFKLYTDKGLVSESEMITVDPIGLEVASVNLSRPQVSGPFIFLNWSRFEGYYFSHYEITVRNYEDGSGSGYQEETIATITDIETLNYLDTDPPYLLDPVYSIHAVDIFGNRSNGAVQGKNSWTLNYKRPEVLDLEFVRQVVQDPSETVLYLYGRAADKPEENFYKFEYASNTMVAISNEPPNTSSQGTMKLIVSNIGKELIIPVGNELRVYNALNLGYKYGINTPTGSIDDFEYLGHGIWIIVDSDNIYTFTRNGDRLSEIAQESHFFEHQSLYPYQILPISNDRILIGHPNEATSLTFKVDDNGIVTDREEVSSVIRSQNESDTRYIASKDIIIGLREGSVYSGSDFSRIRTFANAFYPTGTNKDGTLLFGTPNDPTWQLDDDSLHEKKANVYHFDNGTLSSYATKGYSQVTFENYLGQYISISSGFKRNKLSDYMPKPDIFVEIITP